MGAIFDGLHEAADVLDEGAVSLDAAEAARLASLLRAAAGIVDAGEDLAEAMQEVEGCLDERMPAFWSTDRALKDWAKAVAVTP